MLDELLDEIEDIFSSGHDGVIARMAELSVRLQVKQEELQQAILEAFHCTGKKERKKCAALILCMTTYDVLYGEDNQEASHGENKNEPTETKNEVFWTVLIFLHNSLHNARLLYTHIYIYI